MSITLTFDAVADFVSFVNGVSTNPSTNAQLATIMSAITALKTEEDVMSEDLTQLTIDITNNTSVVGSAETLINGLAAQLAIAIAALPNPAALQALQNQLETNNVGLAAAVAANTATGGPTGGTGATGP